MEIQSREVQRVKTVREAFSGMVEIPPGSGRFYMHVSHNTDISLTYRRMGSDELPGRERVIMLCMNSGTLEVIAMGINCREPSGFRLEVEF